jgi:hypothetical protein
LEVPQPNTSGEDSLNFISIDDPPIIGASISATSVNIATVSVNSGKNSHPSLFRRQHSAVVNAVNAT